ncbi:tubulin polyglutamylase TTLL5 isoform X2 [Anopheles funestus]|uniref:tubulin polyglutamylase TTLL5 isoform X2 n=1 Tax=Anopheles funestus TaxID=62324 RepID=UPI0020C66548|nr:tubulin polyglutamylase TTLL5 isoform X2 [Anopheles funestus]XP_049300965.1 tubulin polyglutamylase TTLL5 isoform X2 [Anopheles funestus]XP_049300966.1 tubulin polyglutamylase TTLL5 isoform X2 [Anopheles funestus]XP_049300967.1 tubulin polyglutamylase TTLL5 isoform X2 [Anopheles funestus]XP_049300968.1 tubulin polyglutamylase TTLL5 isoform X2 [Anopheles funestus]XP_049300969.1 tubulin polyglutamylase TTLL5 isoform X2 [Anopheles funestus]XP_049300970.1 tubulin polyglutamylase TTLL5 isoform 
MLSVASGINNKFIVCGRKLNGYSSLDLFVMPITDKPRLNHSQNAKKIIPATPNPWVAGGPPGGKDAVLVFRTYALSPAASENGSDLCSGSGSPSVTPSSEATASPYPADIAANAGSSTTRLAELKSAQKASSTAPNSTLPKNFNVQRKTRGTAPSRSSTVTTEDENDDDEEEGEGGDEEDDDEEEELERNDRAAATDEDAQDDEEAGEGEGNDDEEDGDETDAGTTSQEESSPVKGKTTVAVEDTRTNKSKKRQLESSSSSSSLSNASMSSVKGGSGDEIDTEMSTSKSEPALAMAAMDKKLAAHRKHKEENKENQQSAPTKTEMPAAQLNICYKFINTETRLLRKILNAHGMGESGPECNDFNLLWTGIHLKPDILRNLAPYQRVNHFPRSYELTRKDRLYKNIERMQHLRGYKHFDIVPQSFLLPQDYKELIAAHNKCRGPWIVKPVASSRGRGIFIVNSPDQISSFEQVVVAKYISDPLCIDGHKCDIRIYVAVTSFDPLIIYIYEEGLVRLATVKYDRTAENLWNPCMHLCNYSINKYHTDYIRSSNAGEEDVGHKWTLSALLRHLRSQGCNTEQLMLAIEDLIIKAIFSCTQPIVSACRMFVPHIGNCFELYGFDILIDDMLKPWLLEVNLSPSLGCDTPLDTKVKASMLTDLLTMVGIPAISPLQKACYDSKGQKIRNLTTPYRRVNSADFVHTTGRKDGPGNGGNQQQHQGKGDGAGKLQTTLSALTAEELKIVRFARSQYERRGGFVRIFPTSDSMTRYGSLLDPITGIPTSAITSSSSGTYLMIIPHNYNQMLHSQLFPAGSETENRIVHRIQKYERALESSLPITIGPKHTAPKCVDEAKRLRLQVRKLIENGHEMSILQARRAFGFYLEYILKRLSSEPKHSHEELIMKFLYRVGAHMKTPFFFRNFGNKALGKDRGAMVAKQLGDYLHLYNKETESYVDVFDIVGMLPIKLFDDFLMQASEADLESVLTLHTNLTQQMPFLYSGCSTSIPPAPPIPVGAHGFLKALPSMAPGGANKELIRLDPFYRRVESRLPLAARVGGLSDARGPGGGVGESKSSARLSPMKKKPPIGSMVKSSREREQRSNWLY